MQELAKNSQEKNLLIHKDSWKMTQNIRTRLEYKLRQARETGFYCSNDNEIAKKVHQNRPIVNARRPECNSIWSWYFSKGTK